MSKKWYPPYKCQYCQAKLYNKDYLAKIHQYAREHKAEKLLNFNCTDCRAWFTYSCLSGKTLNAYFYIGPNRQYRTLIDFQKPLFEVEYYSDNAMSFLQNSETIISLPYIPRNWNPKTAEEKLKLYLLFS